MWRFVALLVSSLLLPGCMIAFPKDREREAVRREEVARPADEPRTVPVVIFADRLHTGVILDLRWLRRHGYVPPEEVKSYRWAAFSWGDETAYVQKEWLTPGQVFQAFALPSRSVMEIIAFDYNIPEVCHHQRLYQGFTTEAAGEDIAAYLNFTTLRDAQGVPSVLGPSSWGGGEMVRSPHSYYFPRICNVWTVEALDAAGFEFHRWTGLSAAGVIRQATARKNGFAQIWDPSWQMSGKLSP
ncbi:hypothetical protein HNR46_002416 [Haloferula luteola]|uniref:DUF2459 domain-containing protein n=1 Tax=Haloferula luteola TaxID=595692 RepID=A0A840V3S3_9BACT|nr:DUF2459 domain-containing protein [Haloferula luteola]MBB5352173.1 hypothetical protein [Haloferula luteola]